VGDARAERFPISDARRKIGLKKVVRFLFLVSGFIVLFLDALITEMQGWSLFTCGCLALVWFLVLRPAFAKKPFGLFVVYDVSLCSLLLFMLDVWFDGYAGWSTSYVTPGLVAAGITLILLCSCVRKVKWSEVGVHVLTLAFMNCVLLLLGILGLIPYMGLCFIVGAYSVICLFGLKYFLVRAFNEELRRKLHV